MRDTGVIVSPKPAARSRRRRKDVNQPQLDALFAFARNPMNGRIRAVAALVAGPCLTFAGVAHADTRVSFSSGVEFSAGDYGGTTQTEVTSIPLSVRVASDDWSFRAFVPYLSITGPADVTDTTDGEGGGGSGDGVVRTGTESGLGDLSLSATRSFRKLGGANAYFDLTGRVRLPTGDENKGLGVGATDYTLSGELGNSNQAGGAYISAGRRFLGERGDRERQDGWQASLGGWLRAGEKARLGGFYYWREASSDVAADPSELGGYVSYRFSDALRVSLNATAGLSEASPDYSTGIRFTWRSDPLGNR